jgi:hypothetical protein
MLIEHRGSAPHVHPSAYMAPTAVLCGAGRAGHGVASGTPATERMSRQAAWFASHLGDRLLDDDTHGES